MRANVAEIVSAYLRRNHLDQSALPEVIATVGKALSRLGQEPALPEAPQPRSSDPTQRYRRGRDLPRLRLQGQDATAASAGRAWSDARCIS